MLGSVVVLLLSAPQLILGSPLQNEQVILPEKLQPSHGKYVVDKAVSAALDAYSDPVAALVSLQPELEDKLAEPRLLHVFGQEKPVWTTEGDKIRLRRLAKKFMDITDHEEFYAQQLETSVAGKASELN